MRRKGKERKEKKKTVTATDLTFKKKKKAKKRSPTFPMGLAGKKLFRRVYRVRRGKKLLDPKRRVWRSSRK